MAGIKTNTQIEKAIKTSEPNKTQYFAIEGYTGLRLRIRGDYVEFQHRYSHPYTKARIQLTLGDYNKGYTLEHARQTHRENLALLTQRIDPIEHKHAQHLAEINQRKNTLQYFINEWQGIQAKKPLASDTYRKQRDNLAPIEKQLGHMRVTAIKPSTVISFINTIQKTTPYKGLAIKSMLKAILQIAVTHRVIEHNPASDLVGTLTPHKTTHRPALTTPAEFAELLQEIDRLPATKDYLKEILELLALTFVRIGDVCAMRWQDINLERGLWEFRPQKAGKREDMIDLVTPLAPQAVTILERMQVMTGERDYVFYNPKRKLEPYTDTQRINKLFDNETAIKMNVAGIGKNYCGQGYKNVHTPHGFRATAKTMLMERLGYDELITELQLGHRMLNRYGGAYSRMEMLDQRQTMMTAWANYLDDLKAGKIDNIIHFAPAKQSKAVNN